MVSFGAKQDKFLCTLTKSEKAFRYDTKIPKKIPEQEIHSEYEELNLFKKVKQDKAKLYISV